MPHQQKDIFPLPPITHESVKASGVIESRRLRKDGGSCSMALKNALMQQTLKTLPKHKTGFVDLHDTAVSALLETGELDVVAEMMSHQLVALHLQAMEMLSKANESCHSETQQSYLNQANKLMRTYAVLAEALRKHCQRGRQTMVVEHVHVHEGGQAIVGNITQEKGVGGR